MHAEPVFPKPRRARRTIAERVRDAVVALGRDHGEVLAHEERPWASITFTGALHLLTLHFEGVDAVEAGEHLIDELPEYEFTMPGHLMADAEVSGIEQTMLPEPRMVVEVAILLLEDV